MLTPSSGRTRDLALDSCPSGLLWDAVVLCVVYARGEQLRLRTTCCGCQALRQENLEHRDDERQERHCRRGADRPLPRTLHAID
jgi:hypothetical protein